METVKWFDRRFSLPEDLQAWPAIKDRLVTAPNRLQLLTDKIAPKKTERCVNGTWSIRQNIGHLSDLETLWQGRLVDILEGKDFLRETDLDNGPTHLANHNDYSASELVERFRQLRGQTMDQLVAIEMQDLLKTSLHPRLHQPMSVLGLFYFVAEHDDHHLNRIQQLS